MRRLQINLCVHLQVISGSHDCTVRLWDLAAGRTKATLTNHKKSVRAVVLNPAQLVFLLLIYNFLFHTLTHSKTSQMLMELYLIYRLTVMMYYYSFSEDSISFCLFQIHICIRFSRQHQAVEIP